MASLWARPDLLSNTQRHSQELCSGGFPQISPPWAPEAAGLSAASWAEQVGTWFHFFCPVFLFFLKILFCLLVIICYFQTDFHWGVIGRTGSEVLLTWLQSITLTKQDFFFPLLSLPAVFLLDHSVCGRGIQTLLHYSLAWIKKAFPYVFPDVCVHITNWTLKSVALNF